MNRTALVPVLAALLAAPSLAQLAHREDRTPRTPGRMLVSGFESGALHVYRTADGAPRGRVDGFPGAQSIVRGPDAFYACAEGIDQVLRVDAATLTVTGPFVADDPKTPEDEDGPLDGPTAAVFGPTGGLFVASFESDAILRYDHRTGEYLGVFVASGLGGLDGPDAGTKFGPDGNLYVPSFFSDRVLRYDGVTGEFIDEFIPFRSGGLRQPRDLVFHDGSWFVASSFNDRVLRYDAEGVFLGQFASCPRPYSLAFHPTDGNLYVVNLQGDNVRIHDGETGAFLRRAITSGSGGVVGTTFVFFPD